MKLSSLSIGYPTRVVAQHISLNIERGTLVALLGPNGSGKSTLLRTLAGLLPPVEGSICIGDQPYPLSQQIRARMLSLVLTERLTIEHTRVRDIVAMGRLPYTDFLGTLDDQDNLCIDRALQATGADRLQEAYFATLSDGEKARVLISKALAQDTPVILLDEPTAHLDLPSRIQTLQLLAQLAHETKRIVIIATHELDLACHFADRILLMHDGNAAYDTPDQLINNGTFSSAFPTIPESIFTKTL